MSNSNLGHTGTTISGYEERGPYHCEDCIHKTAMDEKYCIHPIVVADPDLSERLVTIRGTKAVEIDMDHGCCEYVNQGTDPSLFELRHGETKANKGKLFRGLKDYPLDDAGREAARAAGQWLKKNANIKRIVHSPLGRAKETARIVADILGVTDIAEDERLLPWNVGALAGKPRDENKHILTYLIDNPSVKAPHDSELGSESLNDFRGTIREAVKEYLAEATPENQILLATHSSDIIETEAMISGREARPEDAEVVEPGGLLAVSRDGDDYKTDAVFGKVKEGTFGS